MTPWTLFFDIVGYGLAVVAALSVLGVVLIVLSIFLADVAHWTGADRRRSR